MPIVIRLQSTEAAFSPVMHGVLPCFMDATSFSSFKLAVQIASMTSLLDCENVTQASRNVGKIQLFYRKKLESESEKQMQPMSAGDTGNDICHFLQSLAICFRVFLQPLCLPATAIHTMMMFRHPPGISALTFLSS